jgi:proteasome lid subunit RPN8/RPN11
METLKLTAEAEEVILAHSVGTFPNECCGFFFGTRNSTVKEVSVIMPVTNAKDGDQRRRFQIDPLDYMKAEQFALEQGLDLLGIYHSHPLHPAIPSEHDRKQAMPSFSYIITSVQPDKVVDLTSWQLNDHRQFEQETVDTPFVHQLQQQTTS